LKYVFEIEPSDSVMLKEEEVKLFRLGWLQQNGLVGSGTAVPWEAQNSLHSMCDVSHQPLVSVPSSLPLPGSETIVLTSNQFL
jgi:hypothetical protein